MNKDIKFSFWNYAPFGVVSNVEAVKDWVEAESNLPMSFIYNHLKDKKEVMLELLDECQKHGLKLIISDTRTSFRTMLEVGEAKFIELVKQAYEDFGHHPAAFGFFVGDEPSPVGNETETFIKTTQIVKKTMPNLTPFGNLLPYFGGSDGVMDLSNNTRYEDILDKILKETKLPVIGWDQYSQCLDEYGNQETGINSYFHGLDKYHEITKQNNSSFWMSLLSVGHWCYRVPTEDDIRWQISTAFAHGARGVVWFYFYQNCQDYSYRLSPFANQGLKKTPMFDIIAREQHLFRASFDKYFNKMELESVYHMGNNYDPNHRFVADEYIENIIVDRKLPLIISYYKEFDSEKRYVSFVNGSQRTANLYRITFRNGNKETFWLAPGEMRIFEL